MKILPVVFTKQSNLCRICFFCFWCFIVSVNVTSLSLPKKIGGYYVISLLSFSAFAVIFIILVIIIVVMVVVESYSSLFSEEIAVCIFALACSVSVASVNVYLLLHVWICISCIALSIARVPPGPYKSFKVLKFHTFRYKALKSP